MSEEKITRAKNRPRRTPVGMRNVLSFPQREGYVRRVVNDKDGRIEAFKEAGWEVVAGDATGGPPKAGEPAKMGSAVSKAVGGGITGVLMEIPEDWYKEDQAAKQHEIKKTEDAMKRGPTGSGEYGNVKID